MITLKVITYSTIAFIRAFFMNLFNFFCDSSVFFLTRRNTSVEPFVVSSTTYVPKPAKRLDWITMRFMLFFDRLIDVSMRFMLFFDRLIDVFVPDQTQPRLLSISLSFFKKDASISARSFSARRILFSARSFSNSDISSTDFVRPRLSLRASTPPASYLTV